MAVPILTSFFLFNNNILDKISVRCLVCSKCHSSLNFANQNTHENINSFNLFVKLECHNFIHIKWFQFLYKKCTKCLPLHQYTTMSSLRNKTTDLFVGSCDKGEKYRMYLDHSNNIAFIFYILSSNSGHIILEFRNSGRL